MTDSQGSCSRARKMSTILTSERLESRMTLCHVSWCRWWATNHLKSAKHLPRTRCSHSHHRHHHHRGLRPTFSLPSTWKLCSISSYPRQPCCCYCCCFPTTRKTFETFFLIFFSFYSIFPSFFHPLLPLSFRNRF